MTPHLVSVIIPSYNHASALPECLACVFAQTYRPLEVIVVDDGSTDETMEIIKPFLEKVTFIHQENAGANVARNRGWREAKGEFLLFCDADVVMRTDMVEKMVEVLQRHPEASYAYSSFKFGWKRFPGAKWSSDLLRQVNIAHTTSLIRAQDFPGFDEHIKRFQDWDVWLTMLRTGKCGVMIPEELFVAQVHGVSRIGSSWLPKIAYRVPWDKIGWMPKRVAKYRAAREVLAKKHQLPPFV